MPQSIHGVAANVDPFCEITGHGRDGIQVRVRSRVGNTQSSKVDRVYSMQAVSC